VHTAVKIAPHYSNGPVVYVSDASRSVGVCQSLTSDDAAARFIADLKAEYARIARRLLVSPSGEPSRTLPVLEAAVFDPAAPWTLLVLTTPDDPVRRRADLTLALSPSAHPVEAH
jgi:5-methyltetrahydrofolate--homocysteine methyltransferase